MASFNHKYQLSNLNTGILEASLKEVQPHSKEFTNAFYKHLFTIYPEFKPLFAHTNLEKQKNLFLNFLNFFRKNISSPDVLIAHLKGLGARHVKYGVKPEYYPLFGTALLNTLTQYFHEDWTDELDQAWLDAYHTITALMLEGSEYNYEFLLLKKEAKSNRERKFYSRGKIIYTSFLEIQPRLKQFTNTFYKNLFVSYPEIGILFANTFMIHQEKVFINSFSFIVKNFDNNSLIQAKLKGLGARHLRYGVLPEYYPLFGNILLKTLAQFLKESWTDEVEQAWSESYKIITALMLEGKL